MFRSTLFAGALAAAALAFTAAPASAATTITFEDGDVTGGGFFWAFPQMSVVDDPENPGNKVLFVGETGVGLPDNAFVRMSNNGNPANPIAVITSFEVRATRDTPIYLGLYYTVPVRALHTVDLTADAWTTIDQDFAAAFPHGGDIMAYGGFYIDNVVWEFRDTSPNPPINIPGAGGVPEPGAWALMILGFGLAGGAIRRRHVSAAPLRMS
ncbi:MAG: PEPxxWA-CTERM sorting domain-containing protein [Phenylobacterium sp.]|nr:PEPxxWA-CTERM sorting domain-containing protein [Phenylobacterium sp.]